MPSSLVPERPASPVIKVQGIAHLRWSRPDLARAEACYRDFGLQVSARAGRAVYLRGVLGAHHCWIVEEGPRPELLAIGLTAGSRQDLERLAATPGASPVAPTGEPGGGERVCLRDPSGLRVEVLFGQARLEELPHREAVVYNAPTQVVRVNRRQPEPSGPPEVYRLGHVVLSRQEYARNARWYCQTLGLIPSDLLVAPDGAAALAFLRCDLGDRPSDHHTVVIAFGPEDGVDHCALEVLDPEAVAAGGEWLQRRGYHHVWGIGRHVLGSQIFNYTHDLDGLKIEHYADGDVFDASHPTGQHPLGKAGLYQWGPALPRDFVDASMSPRRLAAIASALRRGGEFTLRRLLDIKKAMAAPARPGR